MDTKITIADLFWNSRDAQVIVREERIVECNRASVEMLGYTRKEDVLGLHPTQFSPELQAGGEPSGELARARFGLAHERGSHRFEWLCRRVNGEVFPVEVTLTVLPIAGENLVHGVWRDLSEQKRMEAARRRAEEDRRSAEAERERALAREQELRVEAETANRLKDEFLATLSHELRTPLTSILGWARLLNSDLLDEENRARGLDAIERNAQVQFQLIEEILDVSRIITGKLRLEIQPMDLATVIESAMDTVRPSADAKGVRLVGRLDPFAGQIAGDPDRLQQVVWNLLSNSIKFTPGGGSVEIRLERMDLQAQITIRDTGLGIRPEFLPYVFDRFRQADASSTKIHGGLGLGLSIVRHLIEMHGGTVAAASEGEGRGASFTFTLPLLQEITFPEPAAGHPEVVARALAHGEAGRLDQVRVLVVEDQPDTRELLTVILRGGGAEVLAAGSAEEALGVFRRFRPHVLLSDIQMPGKDGYFLIQEIRSLPAEEGGLVPAVALTAYATAADRQRALAAGYQEHVAKPVEPAKILEVVARLAQAKNMNLPRREMK
jgi:PAS domain S-box-containing protein